MTTKRVRISTKRVFMEMMLKSNPHKDWDTLLRNLPDFIELDAEILPDPVAEGECCEKCRENPPVPGENYCAAKGCPCHSRKEEKCKCPLYGFTSHRLNCSHTALPPIEAIEELHPDHMYGSGDPADINTLFHKLNEVIRALNRLSKQ